MEVLKFILKNYGPVICSVVLMVYVCFFTKKQMNGNEQKLKQDISTLIRENAELNVQYEPRYVEAREIVRKYRIGKYNPMSPEERKKKMLSKKIIITVLTSLISIALTEAILHYNFADLIAYTISMLMAVVFGILSMADQEKYWVEEFYDYAITTKEEEEAKQKQKQAELKAFQEEMKNNTSFIESLENSLIKSI